MKIILINLMNTMMDKQTANSVRVLLRNKRDKSKRNVKCLSKDKSSHKILEIKMSTILITIIFNNMVISPNNIVIITSINILLIYHHHHHHFHSNSWFSFLKTSKVFTILLTLCHNRLSLTCKEVIISTLEILIS